jgi:signal transduction histidine kinase
VCQHSGVSAPVRSREAPSASLEAGIAVVALTVATLVVSGWYLGFHLSNAHNGLIAASFTAVGLYVVRAQPWQREGWLFVVTGAVSAVMFFGRQYGLHDPLLPGATWIGWLGVWPLPLSIAIAGWTLMAFPDGRLPSPRWRIPFTAMLAVAAIMSLLSSLWPTEYDRIGLVSPHPLNLPGGEVVAVAWDYLQGTYLLFQLLWTAAVVARMRRAEGDETRQLRWLVYAVVVAALVLVAGLVVSGTPVPGALAVPLIALAAGVAILKYRLYDIDPVINKTVVVGAMLLVVTAGYVAIVVGVGSVLPVPDGWLSLLATAVVAVLFQPLRQRAQGLADRIVYGRRDTPYEALSRLTEQLGDPPEDVLEGIAATVARGVGAREVVVWVGDGEELLVRAAWPRDAEIEARSPEELRPPWVVTPVAHQGVAHGAITLRKGPGEALTDTEARLVRDLATQTGLVIVQHRQSDELRAAARRIVTAEDAARRRIERDLHDGAQHRLVTLGLELGALAEQANGHDIVARGVKQARDRLMEATADLRELARGVHPMVLQQAGLDTAVATLADRSPIPVRLLATVGERLPSEVEATAYYVVSEALTNAARHSGADVVSIELDRVEKGLRVMVADDGRGGATSGGGTGIQGLADRVAALGGRLVVDSPAGAGTRIEAVLPCA